MISAIFLNKGILEGLGMRGWVAGAFLQGVSRRVSVVNGTQYKLPFTELVVKHKTTKYHWKMDLLKVVLVRGPVFREVTTCGLWRPPS